LAKDKFPDLKNKTAIDISACSNTKAKESLFFRPREIYKGEKFYLKVEVKNHLIVICILI